MLPGQQVRGAPGRGPGSRDSQQKFRFDIDANTADDRRRNRFRFTSPVLRLKVGMGHTKTVALEGRPLFPFSILLSLFYTLLFVISCFLIRGAPAAT